MTTYTSKTLRLMLSIQTQIELLQKRLNGVANGSSHNGTTRTGSRTMSTKGREAIAAAQRKRWAKFRKARA